ncbi:DMT family transporter [Ruixingdingia sedimenti]|uniref:DMT family transporter n=1 Tax=Ruixingdingia sedimenti TaxID=3073604 RepID=A0ABU1F3R3_9RHOB|nr:DMT family transporter [Xinfangfangia sp. LG-4]MDR5651268.1 DMT family transporter [Xinfangfangia sp. LG-4]
MENLRGAMLMVISMAGFALEDLAIKILARTMPPGQIIVLLGLCGALGFSLLARAQRAPVFSPAFLARPVVLRNLGEMVGTMAMVMALALVPLSLASAILQGLPLMVTLGAALFLGEQVGWRRWTAIAFGFAGMLLILRPFGAGFDPNALWAVVTVVALAMRDVATRRVVRGTSSVQLAVWGFAAIVPAGVVMTAMQGGPVMPTAAGIGLIAVTVGFGMAAYWCLTSANRLGDIAFIAPFRYSRLIFAIALGVLVLHEDLDAPMLAGAGLIIGSGLYSLWRERRRTLSSARASR